MSNRILLYDFYVSKLRHITEDWYASLNRVNNGVYSSTSTEDVERLKQQAMSFHELFFKVFLEGEQTFEVEMNRWIKDISMDEAHLNTANSSKINEFFHTQQQYLQLLDEFKNVNPKVPDDEIANFRETILLTMQSVIVNVTKEFESNQIRAFQAQREVIAELSAPVILLSSTLGLLPLVGMIDTYRARIILTNVLQSCNEKGIDRLIIDLSGVPNVDTDVAKQIITLIKSLSIIGVETCLTGIRPEIAQTTIQLGINLNSIMIFASIQQALIHEQFKTEDITV
ncbi:STAS domain-containing protein [Alkalihalobacillus sp. FSL R5-0424]